MDIFQYRYLIPIFSAIVGALIGGIFTMIGSYIATRKAHKNALQLEVKKQENKEFHFLQGIRSEIHSLWQMHMNSTGYIIESYDNQDILNIWAQNNQDIFIVYKNNSDKLLLLKNDELRGEIIGGYALAIGLSEALTHYYSLVNHYYKSKSQLSLVKSKSNCAIDNKTSSEFEEYLTKQHEALLFHSNQIKELHNELFNKKEIILNLIKAELSITQ